MKGVFGENFLEKFAPNRFSIDKVLTNIAKSIGMEKEIKTYLESLFSLEGRVALVTGGNGGLGLAIALGLGKAGAKVVIGARNEEKNKKALDILHEEGVEAIACKMDVTREAEVASAVENTVERYGALDILVNNAGVSKPAPAHQLNEATWNQVIAVNLTGVLICSREAVKVMKGTKERPAKIINIGSAYSRFGGAYVSAYSASKGGVIQLTRSLAVEWAPRYICVNAILPGWFETEMTAPLKMAPDSLKSIIKRTPFGRFGKPDELAGTAVFLASSASDFITGACVWVDGGYSSA